MEVDCRRCGERKPALAQAPIPGKRGPVLLAQTCADCWAEWVEQSKNIINHYGIEVADPAQRRQLYAVMEEFLRLDTL